MKGFFTSDSFWISSMLICDLSLMTSNLWNSISFLLSKQYQYLSGKRNLQNNFAQPSNIEEAFSLLHKGLSLITHKLAIVWWLKKRSKCTTDGQVFPFQEKLVKKSQKKRTVQYCAVLFLCILSFNLKKTKSKKKIYSKKFCFNLSRQNRLI